MNTNLNYFNRKRDWEMWWEGRVRAKSEIYKESSRTRRDWFSVFYPGTHDLLSGLSLVSERGLHNFFMFPLTWSPKFLYNCLLNLYPALSGKIVKFTINNNQSFVLSTDLVIFPLKNTGWKGRRENKSKTKKYCVFNCFNVW